MVCRAVLYTKAAKLHFGTSKRKWTQSILQKQPNSFLKQRNGTVAATWPDLTPVEYAFQCPKTKPIAERPTNEQQLKVLQ